MRLHASDSNKEKGAGIAALREPGSALRADSRSSSAAIRGDILESNRQACQAGGKSAVRYIGGP
jgi:hypothetical protein